MHVQIHVGSGLVEARNFGQVAQGGPVREQIHAGSSLLRGVGTYGKIRGSLIRGVEIYSKIHGSLIRGVEI